LYGRVLKLIRALAILLFVTVVIVVVWNYSKRSILFRQTNSSVLKTLPPNTSDLTEGFTLNQSENGHTTMELKAKMRQGFKDNKSLFEKVSARFFGKQGERQDTITSDRCEYDQGKEEIVFLGNVIITMVAVTQQNQPAAWTGKEITTIKAPRILYKRNQGQAETEEPVEFFRGKIQGTCRGLSYDANQGILKMRAEVKIQVAPDHPGNSPVLIGAGALNFFNTTHELELLAPVKISQSPQELSCDYLKAHLNADQTVTRIETFGHIRAISYDPGTLMGLTSGNALFFFHPGGKWLEKVSAGDQVKVYSLDPAVKRDLKCAYLELILQSEGNRAQSLHASGNVDALLGKRNPGKGKESSRRGEGPLPGDRWIQSPEMTASFRPDGRQLEAVSAKNGARVEEFTLASQKEKRVVQAREISVYFAPDNRAERMTAENQVKVQVVGMAGVLRTTWSDHMEGQIDQGTQQFSQIRQFGHFHYEGEQWQATAEEARYLAAEKLTRLDGQPVALDPNSKTSADHMEFLEAAHRFQAEGHVRSVLTQPKDKPDNAGIFHSSEPVYASAESLDIDTQTKIARYRRQAKLWQGEQLLRADLITLYRNEKKLEAEKGVSSLFYFDSQQKPGSSQSPQKGPTLVEAESFLYLDSEQKAVYQKNVRMRHPLGQLQSDRLEVFLEKDEQQTRAKRMLAIGQVKIFQPKRTGMSEMAEYFRAGEKMVLSGGSPRVIDSERGSTSGARLTLYRNNDSIFVEGTSETRSYAQPR
jgi:LPS export ABC transporter protein LptC